MPCYSSKFTDEFKLKAISLVLDEHRPVAMVAKELGIAYSSLYRWLHRHEAEKERKMIRAQLMAERECLKAEELLLQKSEAFLAKNGEK